MERLVSLLGLCTFLFLAWLMSENKRRMNFRLILSGLAIQFLMAAFLLRTTPGRALYQHAGRLVTVLVDCSKMGAEFLVGPDLVGTCPAFSFLPAIIFVSSLTAILFHLGILQWCVKIMASLMVRIMDVSGTESLAACANVFVGMTEAPLVIRPYLKSMTRSELMAMLTSGLATVAGGVMAVYAGFLREMGVDPGHLLAASLISVPASLVIAKIMVPETEQSLTKGLVKIEVPKQDANVLDAACRGAAEGLKLAANVAAMLIAFISLVALVNWSLSGFSIQGTPLTLERMLGWVGAPMAWLMGVPADEAEVVGSLLGQRTVLNEFVAYMNLKQLPPDALSPRSVVIATYALCGFANFASVAIQIGGIGSLEPGRRKDFAKYSFRSMIGGTLAAYMTATIAGILYVD